MLGSADNLVLCGFVDGKTRELWEMKSGSPVIT